MSKNNKDYLPGGDQAFKVWVGVFLSVLASILPRIEFPADVHAELTKLYNDFVSKLGIADAPATRTKAAVQAKNDARKALTAYLRQVIGEYLTRNHRVTDADRDNLGLPIHDTKPTPPPVPTDMPVGEVDTSKHQQHKVRVKAGSLTGRAKPPQVHGFEAWRKIGGAPPASDEEWVYVNFKTSSPMLINYPQTEVGQTVYYRFRWVNSANEPGPWSDAVSAVIP